MTELGASNIPLVLSSRLVSPGRSPKQAASPICSPVLAMGRGALFGGLGRLLVLGSIGLGAFVRVGLGLFVFIEIATVRGELVCKNYRCTFLIPSICLRGPAVEGCPRTCETYRPFRTRQTVLLALPI